ncbi:MAG: dethiobiotin synthase [Rhodocyclaceae bacterium]|nr:dethiobiotin synthase [Rhodocyclaceae bacterium]
MNQRGKGASGGAAFFVTGTDTEVGKTFVSVRLLHALRRAGETVLAMKPVAAGCEETPEGWRNEDVEALRNAASFPVAREAMNPYLFLPPVSPHLAAAEAGVMIEMDVLRRHLETLQGQAEQVLVEGAGGWLSPLSDSTTMADLAAALELPVLLVVGLRLGCLNHALLTFEAIRGSGLPFLGWVANCVDPAMSGLDENLAYLTRKLGPPLAVVPHGASVSEFDLGPFLGLLGEGQNGTR